MPRRMSGSREREQSGGRKPIGTGDQEGPRGGRAAGPTRIQAPTTGGGGVGGVRSAEDVDTRVRVTGGARGRRRVASSVAPPRHTAPRRPAGGPGQDGRQTGTDAAPAAAAAWAPPQRRGGGAGGWASEHAGWGGGADERAGGEGNCGGGRATESWIEVDGGGGDGGGGERVPQRRKAPSRGVGHARGGGARENPHGAPRHPAPPEPPRDHPRTPPPRAPVSSWTPLRRDCRCAGLRW